MGWCGARVMLREEVRYGGWGCGCCVVVGGVGCVCLGWWGCIVALGCVNLSACL